MKTEQLLLSLPFDNAYFNDLTKDFNLKSYFDDGFLIKQISTGGFDPTRGEVSCVVLLERTVEE